jgi:hypothetical protein
LHNNNNKLLQDGQIGRDERNPNVETAEAAEDEDAAARMNASVKLEESQKATDSGKRQRGTCVKPTLRKQKAGPPECL